MATTSFDYTGAAMDRKPPDRKSAERDAHETDVAASKTTPGTEARRKGGVEPAKRQAERDWEDSAKESGD
jgi:hypothetical protein